MKSTNFPPICTFVLLFSVPVDAISAMHFGISSIVTSSLDTFIMFVVFFYPFSDFTDAPIKFAEQKVVGTGLKYNRSIISKENGQV